MAVTYRISELAADLAVTTRTIRFYEEQGLISPSRRGHERIYTLQERHLLRIALTGKQLGLPLAECRELLELFQTDDPAISDEQLHEQLGRVAHYQQFLSEQKRAITTLAATLGEIKMRCQQVFDSRLAESEELPSGEEQPSLFNAPAPEARHRAASVPAETEEIIQRGAGSVPLHDVRDAEQPRSIAASPVDPKQDEDQAHAYKREHDASHAAAKRAKDSPPTPSRATTLPSVTDHGEFDLFSALEDDQKKSIRRDEAVQSKTHKNDDNADDLSVDDDGQFSFPL